jgi:hypothetical protein
MIRTLHWQAEIRRLFTGGLAALLMRIRTFLALAIAAAGLVWGLWALYTRQAAAARQLAQW